jgi:hypothetical protein
LRHSGGHYQDKGRSGECAGGLHKVHEILTLAVPSSHYSALEASLNWTIRPRKHARDLLTSPHQVGQWKLAGAPFRTELSLGCDFQSNMTDPGWKTGNPP